MSEYRNNRAQFLEGVSDGDEALRQEIGGQLERGEKANATATGLAASVFTPFPYMPGTGAIASWASGVYRAPTFLGRMGGHSIAGAAMAGVKKGAELAHRLGRPMDRIPEALWTNTMKMHNKLTQKHPNLRMWNKQGMTRQIEPAKAIKESRAEALTDKLGRAAMHSPNTQKLVDKPAGLFDFPEWGYMFQWRTTTQNAFRRKAAEKAGIHNPAKNAHRIQKQPDALEVGPTERTFPWLTGREAADFARQTLPYMLIPAATSVGNLVNETRDRGKKVIARDDHGMDDPSPTDLMRMSSGARSRNSSEQLYNQAEGFETTMEWMEANGGITEDNVRHWNQTNNMDFFEYSHGAQIGIERAAMRYHDVNQRVLDEEVVHPAFANTESFNFDYAKDHMDELNFLMSPENPDYQSRMSAFQHNVGDTELQNKINSMNRRMQDMETMARTSPAQFRMAYGSASPEEWHDALWEMPDYAWRTQ